MTACRTYRSHCFTEAKNHGAVDWQELVQLPATHVLQELSVFLEHESCSLHGESLSAECCHLVRLWADFPFSFSSHTQLKCWCKCLQLLLSPLTEQSRTLPYSNLPHCHQEQMLVVLLAEYQKVVTRRTG